MKDFKSQPWWTQTLIILVIVAGAYATWNSLHQLAGPPQQKAMTGQEIKAQFQAAEAQDRANYEKMWRDEGKPPPPLPAYQSIPVENQN